MKQDALIISILMDFDTNRTKEVLKIHVYDNDKIKLWKREGDDYEKLLEMDDNKNKISMKLISFACCFSSSHIEPEEEHAMTTFASEILCIGNELLSGITVNTNAHWLSQKITESGVSVRTVTETILMK